MKIPVAIKILNEATGPKANVEFMDVSILKTNQFEFLIVFSLTSFLSVVTWKSFCCRKVELFSPFIFSYVEMFHQVSQAHNIVIVCAELFQYSHTTYQGTMTHC